MAAPDCDRTWTTSHREAALRCFERFWERAQTGPLSVREDRIRQSLVEPALSHPAEHRRTVKSMLEARLDLIGVGGTEPQPFL